MSFSQLAGEFQRFLGPGLSEIWISPSELLMVRYFAKARLTPPAGRPMLSRIISIRSRGRIFRISSFNGGEDLFGLFNTSTLRRQDVSRI